MITDYDLFSFMYTREEIYKPGNCEIKESGIQCQLKVSHKSVINIQ